MDKPDNSAYDYRALSLLAASDRLQHTEKIIKKHLENGEIVISDRYFYSCLANLHARGCFNDKWIYEISKYIINPDFAFFLNVDVEVAISRVRLREEEKNRYINLDLQYALHKEYLEIAKDNGIVINSQKDMEETFLDILYSLFNKQEECEAYNLEEVAI